MSSTGTARLLPKPHLWRHPAGSARDALDGRGESAIAYACFFGHADCVQLLLVNSADPNIADDDGVTPLHW